MRLIDELIERHTQIEHQIDAHNAQVSEHYTVIDTLVAMRTDLDRAIAALGSFIAEDDAILYDSTPPEPEPVYAAADAVVADAYAVEIISELTGDPAIEAESGLHGEAVSEDGYAPVTNPEADAIAQAQDWYSPEQVAEREKASRPWSGMGNLWGKPKVDA